MDKHPVGSKQSRCRKTVQIVVDIIIWLAVTLPVVYIFLHGKPYKTGFFCDDKSLSYPTKASSVSTSVLIAAGLTLSLLLVVVVEVLNCVDNRCRGSCQRTSDVMYCVKSYIVFLIGFLIEEMVVEAVKNKMGALRPNFFDVCKPHFNRTLCPGFIVEYTCTRSEDDKDLRISRQAFPSGHAAFSMYLAFYFCIYVENRLQIRFSRLLKIFLQSTLVLIAILCGVGRIKDNKHHSSDVIAGSLLGLTVAIAMYMLFGRRMSKSTSGTNSQTFNMMDKQCDCFCTCEESRDLESQRPGPLLRNQYTSIDENGRDSSFSKISSLQDNTIDQCDLALQKANLCQLENV